MHELMFQAGVKGMSERSELIPCTCITIERVFKRAGNKGERDERDRWRTMKGREREREREKIETERD